MQIAQDTIYTPVVFPDRPTKPITVFQRGKERVVQGVTGLFLPQRLVNDPTYGWIWLPVLMGDTPIMCDVMSSAIYALDIW